MADELGVSASLVHYDCQQIREQWRRTTISNVEEAAILDVARLEYIINGLLPTVHLDSKVADAAVRAIMNKAKILGYGNGLNIDLENYLRSMAEQLGLNPETAIEIAQRITVSQTKTIKSGG